MTENKAQPEKLDLRLQNIAGVKQQELLRLFPEVREHGRGMVYARYVSGSLRVNIGLCGQRNSTARPNLTEGAQ